MRSRRWSVLPRAALAAFVVFVMGSASVGSVGVARGQSGAAAGPAATLSASYASTVLADAPVAYWRLGESSGTTAVDASGNGNDSTYLNGVSLGSPGGISGNSDTAVTLDGVDDRVNRAPVTTQTSNVTIEAWVYWSGCCNNVSTGAGPIIIYNGDTGAGGFGLLISSGAGFACGPASQLFVLLGGVTCNAAGAGGVVPTNTWTHVAATHESGNVWNIYVNGVETTQQAGSPNPGAIVGGGTAIGDEFQGSGGAGQFQGRVDEVAVYNTALSPARILAHYLAGADVVAQPIEQTIGGCDQVMAKAACATIMDPVVTLTGAFTHEETDLSLAATGVPYSLTRSYTSIDPTVGRFGPGWTDTYAVSLGVQPNGDVKLHAESGQQVTFALQPDGSFVGGAGVLSTLESIAGGYRLTRNDQVVYEFDTQGRVTSEQDRNGNGVTVAYDGSGRLLTVTDAASNTATYGYAGAGTLVTSVTLSDGHSTGYGYTSGRLTAFTDVRGKVWTYSYDAGGRLTSIVDPLSHAQVTNVYDPTSGRVTSQTDATNKTTTFAWDAPTQTATVTDPNNHAWKDAYVNNVLVSRTDGANNTTQLGHDTDLNGTSVTGPTNETTNMTFDADGNVLTATAPPSLGSVSKTFTYNANNDPLTVTDARGKVTSYTYTAAGNVETVTQDGIQVSSYTYDAQGRVGTSTDGNSKTTSYTYDTDGNVETVTAPDPDGPGPLGLPVTSYTYDGQGNVLTRVDPKGNVSGCGCAAQFTTTFTYNAAGQQLTETDPLGHVTTNVYDDAGRLTSTTDAKSHTTSYTYDNANRVLTETRPDPDGAGPLAAPVTTSTYDDAGNKLTETDPRGNVTTFAYDNANRLVSTTGPDPDGAGVLAAPVTTNTYDANGNLASTVEPRGNVAGGVPDDYRTTYTYDAAGRVLTTTTPDPDGAGSQTAATTTNVYDNVGSLATVTDAKGHVTSYTYDATGRILTVTAPDPDGAGALSAPVTTYTYDPVGNQLTKTDANNHTTTSVYDGLNRAVSVTSPDPDGGGALTASVASYTFDLNGNQATMTDAIGNNTPAVGDNTTTYGYDAANRLTSINYSDSTPDASFTLDNVGNRLSMVDGPGTQTRTYDNLDRLLTVTRSTNTFTYVYDAAGNITKRTYPDATVIDYTYDPLGRMASVVTGTRTTSYAYDPASNPITTTLPTQNGYVETRTFDRAGRLNGVKYVKGATTLADINYVRDSVGNPLTEVRTGALPVSKTFTYDNMDRVTGVCYLATSCPGATDPYIRWTYDGVGNRLTEARPSVATTSYTYDNMDRMLTAGATSYTYDRNGNELSAGTRTFTYDLANRMKTTVSGATTSTYTYDGDGVRTQTSTGTAASAKVNFLWDVNNGLPMVAREANGNNVLQRRYIYGQRLVFMSTSASNAFYFHYDPLGSVRNVTSQTGGTSRTYDYEPYGAIRSQSGSLANFVKFTGEYEDPTGLYHLRARQYDPAIGRFTSVDPVEQADTLPGIGSHQYAGVRPTINTDPSGKVLQSSGAGVAATQDVVSFAAPMEGGSTPRRVYPFPRRVSSSISRTSGNPTGRHPSGGLPGYPAIDFLGAAPAPILAVESGRIRAWSGRNPASGLVNGDIHGPFGWSLYLLGDSGVDYYYTHLGSRSASVGQRVQAGQRIGQVGDYSNYGGVDHLHLGANVGGKVVAREKGRTGRDYGSNYDSARGVILSISRAPRIS